MDLSCEEHNILNEIAIFSATGADILRKVRILRYIRLFSTVYFCVFRPKLTFDVTYSLPGCSFTGILPLHLNQCINLVELDLSNNFLHAFPRCLYLPKLERLNLRNNPFLVRFAKEAGPPLIEQFPKLTSVELDLELKEVRVSTRWCISNAVLSFLSHDKLLPSLQMLRPQSLAYLCPNLNSINGEDFSVDVTEETVKTAQAVKQELAGLVRFSLLI